MRVCAEPSCPNIQPESRCAEHRRQRDKARGTRQQRGYDATYDRERKRIERDMQRGAVYVCWRCERVVTPDAFDLGHCDDNRRVLHGVEHPACNRGARGACPHISHVVS